MSKIKFKKECRPMKAFFRDMRDNKRDKYAFAGAILLILLSIMIFFFVSKNETYYKKTIAKITSITQKDAKAEDMNGNTEHALKQNIKAVIMNGRHKGESIQLQNTSSDSQSYDLNLKVKDEVFVAIKEDTHSKIVSAGILDFKRDKYVSYMVILFVLLVLLIGGYKGFKSLVSVIINIGIFSAIIGLFLSGYNLLLIASIASILFILVSIILVSGVNKKTLSAVTGTVAGTLLSMLITAAVIYLTHGNGIYYEEMSFLNHPPEKIFFVEILVGTLGAIMDIAITVSSSLQEIYDNNPLIEKKVLINSAMEIGKDIMGTMANTLVFAYVSGSIPMILILLKNSYSLSYIIGIDMSLEIIRALTGSIGIMVSIPVTMVVSILLLKKSTNGDLKL